MKNLIFASLKYQVAMGGCETIILLIVLVILGTITDMFFPQLLPLVIIVAIVGMIAIARKQLIFLASLFKRNQSKK